MAEYMNVSEVLERLSDDRSIDGRQLSDRVRNARIWQAIVSFPGCLGDSYSVARSREDCLSSVTYWIDEEHEYSSRYIKGRLRRFGICYLRDGRVITCAKMTIGDLF